VERAKLRDQYLQALDRYGAAEAMMRQAMQEGAEALPVLRRQAEAGLPMADVAGTVRPDGIRNRLSTAAVELERARHEATRLLFSILVDEGMTMADVGRMFGVSRSLVSRFVNESRPPS
jgi:predicted DNA-binding protein (UPF0251 family)